MYKFDNKQIERWSPWILLLAVVLLWQVLCAALDVSPLSSPALR